MAKKLIGGILVRRIPKELALRQRQREAILAASRLVLQRAKQAIFFLHHDNRSSAAKELAAAAAALQSIMKKMGEARLQADDNFLAALEEYGEAQCFKQALSRRPLAVTIPLAGAEVTVGSLADCTGELVRYATLKAGGGDYRWIDVAYDYTNAAVELLLPLYLGGKLRQKFDEARRNLHRLEQMRYEVRLSGRERH